MDTTLSALKGRIRLFKIHINRQGYDRGGRYWGYLPGEPLYLAEGETAGYVHLRAFSREKAKEKITKAVPDAKFYR